jgi:trans-aconitate 2-methyltransferase
MPWDPSQYLKFADQRLRPAIDLLSRIEVDDPRHVYDLGAGSGNVTRLLAKRWPHARITGVDADADMLAKARAGSPEIDWQRADLSDWQPPTPANVIFANASLHWVGDHQRLFPELLGHVAPHGALAVQMPRNFSEPSHTAIAEAVRAGPWRATLEPLLRPAPVGTPESYFDLLEPLASTVDIWETDYLHPLEGHDPVKEWTKGTWLRPFLEALLEPERGRFEECYAELVRRAYPRRADGRTLFSFRRLFIVATAADVPAPAAAGRSAPPTASGG